MEGVIICIRDNIINESKNQLVSMLEVLFTKLEAEKKKKILSENHGIIMSLDIERRINEMCNLSEAIEERGIERGKIITLLELVDSKEISAERFVEKTGYTVEEARKICECD